jgi:hypothetical protein
MSTLSPEAMFALSLALKIAMTVSIVVAASVVVERSGPFVGALIASLPTAGGAAMIILALEHSPAFIAESVIGSIVANAVCCVFALSYAVLAQRHGWLVSLAAAYLVWLAGVTLARLVEWNLSGALALSVVLFTATIVAGRRFRTDTATVRVKTTAADIAWRAGVVTLCVIVVTTASHWIGSFASGAFAFFPVAMGSFFLILHTRVGGPQAASVAAHVQAPLIGLSLGFVAVHYLAEPLGVWWSYLIALAIGVAWNALLWIARRNFQRIVIPAERSESRNP